MARWSMPAWVLFEDCFLFISIKQSGPNVLPSRNGQAKLEASSEHIVAENAELKRARKRGGKAIALPARSPRTSARFFWMAQPGGESSI